ncbi:TrmH family RNA methyltransferase [Sphingomonas phyllosphaerae]|uniref:TrmH family RNA methyltransferase n=1 Tax=Sphingomonas phyllosphaerae TaxID=257003 RepID=UPI000424BA70|nr:TrmH family RNA methyltransferase [Sphingomonas phyllosphaerae]
MSFYTYLLRCADGSYYVGHCDDLEARIGAHQAGTLPGYTQSRRPVEVLWSQDFSTRDEALGAERRIKGWSRAKKEALVRGDWAAIRSLASRAVLRDEASTGSASPQDERRGDGKRLLDAGSNRPDEGESGSNPTHIVGPASGNKTRGEQPAVPPPVIVLVRPQLGENIGKAARAMLNFGLVELRLVAPRDGWPNPQAGPAASGADIVLERAAVFDSVADAVADCAHVYATTVRKRGVTKPVVTPAEAAQTIHAGPARSAILFGPERSGLETDDVAVARTIITVPINPEFGSLNLAQAVILVAYEWSKGQALASPPAVDADPPAPQIELDGMIAQLDALLDDGGYFYPPDRTPTTRRMLRTLLTKPGWSSQEVRTVRGILSTLVPKRPRGG